MTGQKNSRGMSDLYSKCPQCLISLCFEPYEVKDSIFVCLMRKAGFLMLCKAMFLTDNA